MAYQRTTIGCRLMTAAAPEAKHAGIAKKVIAELADSTVTIDILRATRIRETLEGARKAFREIDKEISLLASQVSKRFKHIQKEFEKRVGDVDNPTPPTQLPILPEDDFSSSKEDRHLHAEDLGMYGKPIPPQPVTDATDWSSHRRFIQVDGTHILRQRWFPWTSAVPIRREHERLLAMGPYVIPQ
eukprot:gene81-3474_t